jgi:GNAT superfamily N-acetyltransferase
VTPAEAGLSIRRANPGDAEDLTAIAHRAKRHWGYGDELIALWSGELTFTPEAIARSPVYLAEAEGCRMGVYALEGASSERELEHLWVDPQFMGRGVARALLAHALEQARADGASRIWIVSDPNAEEFYRHMGARRVGEVASTPEGRKLPVLLLQCDVLGVS